MDKIYTFSLWGRVSDEAALMKAAREKAIEDGIPEEDVDLIVCNVEAAITTLLDRIIPGFDISDSNTEED